MRLRTSAMADEGVGFRAEITPSSPMLKSLSNVLSLLPLPTCRLVLPFLPAPPKVPRQQAPVHHEVQQHPLRGRKIKRRQRWGRRTQLTRLRSGRARYRCRRRRLIDGSRVWRRPPRRRARGRRRDRTTEGGAGAPEFEKIKYLKYAHTL